MEPRYAVIAQRREDGAGDDAGGCWRIGGQVELAGIEAEPNWKRAEVLLKFARRVYPDLPEDSPPERIKMWMGHRPSTPDGLPCLGPASGCADIVHAFGHGHVGLTAGATTGKIVAEIVGGLAACLSILRLIRRGASHDGSADRTGRSGDSGRRAGIGTAVAIASGRWRARMWR